ncbi:MAG: helix-turn-helix domain-containing protein, partial [Clostridia bacterium]
MKKIRWALIGYGGMGGWHVGKVQTMQEFEIAGIWDIDSDADVAVIMEHISRIRAKFAEVGCKPYIQTVWGSGYKWI